MFDSNSAMATDSLSEVENYLNVYTSGPLTKAEVLNRFADGQYVDPEFANKF